VGCDENCRPVLAHLTNIVLRARFQKGLNMTIRRTSGRLTAALALVTGALTVSSAPAAAAEACPSGQYCAYEQTGFVAMGIQTGTINRCFDLDDYGTGFHGGILSYRNNMSVSVKVYHWTGSAFVLDGTESPGHFSSNTTANPTYGDWGVICTGTAHL
jgi:hypothetical protein